MKEHIACCGWCGKTFNSAYALQRHRTNGNPPLCLTAAELTARGWVRTALGVWAINIATFPSPKQEQRL